jgi:transcriptional regulator with XRE-family HTH domain
MSRFESYLSKVGQNLKSARMKIGITQSEIADQSGIEYRYYQRMEAGKVNMTLQSLFRLAQILGTKIHILTNESPPSNNTRHSK